MLSHINKQFHAELNIARVLFMEMGQRVLSMLKDSMLVMAEGDTQAMERVRADEKQVNRLEVDIDERIVSIIARHQPAAIDLRFLLSISKMLTDMERCGDEAEKIVKKAYRLHESGSDHSMVVELKHMAELVSTMLHNALDAFDSQNPIAAAQVMRADKEVNREWKATLRHISTYMIEDPRTISRSIDLIFIARALERIGDHAKNMAERVIFMVRGTDVRHTGVKNAERMARGEEEAIEN